jgi:hypothetical protein
MQQKNAGFSPCGLFFGNRGFRREPGVSQLAEKCKGWSKKRQGTTSVVPYMQQKNAGFSPCGLLFV